MPRVNVKDKRKQQLMDANLVSIAKRGLADTTITHVSEGANMSRGIVNFYFDSKEKMMQETLAYLVSEYNSCWQGALDGTTGKEPIARIEAVIRTLLADKQCSQRRLSALSAFIAHAGTHAGYSKVLCASDDLFTRQIKALFQQAGVEAKQAETRARQVLAVIRGHYMVSFLNPEWGKPSLFADSWVEALCGKAKPFAQVPVMPVAEAPLVEKPPAPVAVKPKKPAQPAALPGQLDFGDLFAKT